LFDTLNSRIAALRNPSFQELRLPILHERRQPVAASLPPLDKLLREFLTSALRHYVLDRRMTIRADTRSGMGLDARQSPSRNSASSALLSAMGTQRRTARECMFFECRDA
jgi:hypothetical protein